jgi:hypothetical protein
LNPDSYGLFRFFNTYQLVTEFGDFTKPDFQKQTDGALFYKTSEGRKDMPSFKKKIADQNDIWAVINYMRTLK